MSGTATVWGINYSILDADAEAFITAAGITDPTQQSAIRQHVTDLKGYGLWAGLQLILLMVGGVASAHKFNLKDPRDLDVAFRTVFNGSWTHSATGALPDGSTAYGDTKYTGSVNGTDNDHQYSIYIGTDTIGGAIFDLGALTSSLGPQFIARTNLLGGSDVLADNTNGRATASNADARGFYTATRPGAGSGSLYKNGSSIGVLGADSVSISSVTNPYYIGARNLNGAANGFSDREIRYFALGASMNATQAANFNTAVQAFQTALGR